MKPIIFSLALAAVAGVAAAQDYYPRHNFTFGVGAAQPRADLNGLFKNSPGISFSYGYRFARNFQADAGFETVFGAADVRDFLNTEFGPVLIKDYQYFVPLGGRAILPLIGGRLLFSGGGGGAYMRYSERLRQPSDFFRIACPVCTSRSGWGYYALVDISTFVDNSQHFRVGVVSKVYRGHTNGEPLAALPGVRTRDHWVNIMGQVGFSF
ncbi:MAG TPA: hypothetical protein PLA43_07140 [Bryobacteraceae bacterium]|nr:hypothetical protein [Bryobacteraceae bacterium]HOL70088.1 hypothetical protein [Bryobacteraceae bacterium]HOQ43842.1 hypothetical protein [Bryobacteraceae bacterium]HPQ14681.1 hypothetical protein [Bryobacteraceae bacterium]HPU71715.1 hypothetical protein [Bryobacteraceae bacterium]